jgi:glutaryl-CoA dehydrogenase
MKETDPLVTDADFYLLERELDPAGRQLRRRVREFMEKTIQPVINQYWTREEFPHDLVRGSASSSAGRSAGSSSCRTCW